MSAEWDFGKWSRTSTILVFAARAQVDSIVAKSATVAGRIQGYIPGFG
jgi:hypothetical protein